jgi:hypothetical protein
MFSGFRNTLYKSFNEKRLKLRNVLSSELKGEMDSKWPFMLIIFGLLIGLGFVISKLERNGVMKNWNKRRCEFPVMATGAFFKPSDDPRTSSKFASDNFQFCMKSYVEKFIELALAPFQTIFSKHSGIAGNALDMLSTIRNIASTMFNSLSGFLDTYFRKFTFSIYEMSRIVQYLRMAMRRVNALMINFLYTSLTMFRGMLNTIQFVIKVILIVCGILLVLIIILIFVLFPMIPMILAVLGAIIATILAMVMAVGGVVDEAISDKKGFCFSGDTKILIKTSTGEEYVPINTVKIGQELGSDCGKVTATLYMDGTESLLHNLDGIYVSGSHVVYGIDGAWKLVEQDERAILSEKTTDILYSFNTTSRKLPVYNPKTKDTLLFRDWEEISEDDTEGQYLWNYNILKYLNKASGYENWKSSLKLTENTPLISPYTQIKTSSGYVQLSELDIKKHKIVDSKNKEQHVLGTINGIIDNANKSQENDIWYTDLYMYNTTTDIWYKADSTVIKGNDLIIGKTIICEEGEFVILDKYGNEHIVRDFTDIGYNSIHKTYSFVAERLRSETNR